MQLGDEFSLLLDRVRHGESDAAREIVRRYESAIRIAVRTRLTDPRLRRQFDSLDVCQSVLTSFFIHMASGSYDLREPRQLAALLTKMAQHKLGMRARRHFRICRDARRISAVTIDEIGPVCGAPSPMRHAAGKESLFHALQLMSPEVRAIALRRMQGEGWAQIAMSMGGTPDGRRKQFQREVDMIVGSIEWELVTG